MAVTAPKLKEVFGLDDINGLLIAFPIAWYGQQAVIVLLALLYLGVKNIYFGPTLPAFLSPNVAKGLVDHFGIAGIGAVEEDMDLFFGKKPETENNTAAVTADMRIGDILRQYPQAAEALMGCGMHCLGCPSAQAESLADACMVHGLNVEDVLANLNAKLNK